MSDISLSQSISKPQSPSQRDYFRSKTSPKFSIIPPPGQRSFQPVAPQAAPHSARLLSTPVIQPGNDMSKANLTMESRTGRNNQRYGPTGERLVAGVVPLSSDKKRVLLIQSARRGGWVLPKGGWELDEATAAEAACREAWEEAGVICRIEKELGHITDRRPASALTKLAPKAAYQFFEAVVTEEKLEWPEMKTRSRRWFAYKEAVEALAARPELLEALEKSSISRESTIMNNQRHGSISSGQKHGPTASAQKR